MKRRSFFANLMAGMGAGMGLTPAQAASTGSNNATGTERAYLLALLRKMAVPILENLAAGTLKKNFPIEYSPTWRDRSADVCYLEAFGRLLAGIAPWLALPDDSSSEGQLRQHLRTLAQRCLANGVNPQHPDYLGWGAGPQVLVDSAYLCNALLRAPKALWEPLDDTTKTRLIAEIQGARRYELPYNNWVLFAAMNEAWLLSIGQQADILRLNTGLRKAQEWYAGDGWLKDGDSFHFDYYNSYVMWPMLLEILQQLDAAGQRIFHQPAGAMLAQTLKRTQRYCEHLERLVSPEGTYPTIGRSLTYRTAAFQPLALLAWQKRLPASLPEGQVRAVLHAVHQAVWRHPGNFGAEGFLTLGFAGHNPQLADWYSNNGSMYIAATSLLTLGLPADDSYWRAPALEWTQQRAWSGQPFAKDYAVDY